VAYAQATRPDTLTAVTVNVDDKDTRALQEQWERRQLPVPLTVVHSPYREITRPIMEFVKSVRRSSPRDVVTVFIPEYVVGKWWENLLHNQSALRLKGRLLFEPGVMVTSVPWQLESTVNKDLARLDQELSRGPIRGPRAGGPRRRQRPGGGSSAADAPSGGGAPSDGGGSSDGGGASGGGPTEPGDGAGGVGPGRVGTADAPPAAGPRSTG
jgi:uncharacterized membrane protein YgcG